MANLLPEQSRIELRREYRARYILAGSYIAIGAALCMTLALLPSYVVYSTTLPKERATHQASQETKTDLEDLTRAKALLQQLGPFYASTSTITQTIAEALAAKPKGVHIDEISFQAQTNDSVALGGFADSRESINAFRSALSQTPRFTSVKLPVGDLIGGQGGRFTVTLSGKF